MNILLQHIVELKSLCNTHKVSELYVFGSVLQENFNDNSDIDFLVRFDEIQLEEYFDNYMDLKEKLENVFKRKIDLVEYQYIKNPIFRQIVDRTKIILYERAVA